MEIICIEKKTFDEFRTRFCELEGRMARLCRSQEDTGLKNWMDNQDVCDVLHISKKKDVQSLLESSYHAIKRKP